MDDELGRNGDMVIIKPIIGKEITFCHAAADILHGAAIDSNLVATGLYGQGHRHSHGLRRCTS